uniref:Uncharacterized protein n=1 Tax=Cacopsylla melanoneura TaxID=428564 RepID=A0A8D8RTQ8_9HEMI
MDVIKPIWPVVCEWLGYLKQGVDQVLVSLVGTLDLFPGPMGVSKTRPSSGFSGISLTWATHCRASLSSVSFSASDASSVSSYSNYTLNVPGNTSKQAAMDQVLPDAAY